jgi:hypothetical protein
MDLTVTGRTQVVPPTAAQLYDGQFHDGIFYPDRYQWLPLELAEPNLGIPMSGIDLGSLITGSYAFSSTQTFLLCSNQRGERGWVAFNAAEQQFDSEERPDLTNVDMGLEWLLYRDPIIINFQLSAQYFGNFEFRPGVVGGNPSIPVLLEAGTDPNALGTGVVTLSWVTNKIDARAIRTFFLKSPNGTINDSRSNAITGGFSFRTYTLPKIDTTTQGTSTFYLTAQDWRGDKAEAFLEVRALGPIFFGITSSTASTILSSTVKNGAKTTTGTPAITYSFNPGSPNNQTQAGSRLFIAWPTSLNYTPNRFIIAPSILPVIINTGSPNNYRTNLKVLLDSGAEVTYTVFVTENFYNSNPTALTLI